jgi:phage baseplate assembly protein W
MAIIIQNTFPIDTLGYKTIGFSFPMDEGAVFPATTNVLTQLKYNLINYLMTEPGEVYLNTNFGAGLQNVVFEQITSDNLSLLEQIIKDKIQNAFPQISVQKIEVLGTPDQNQIRIIITYNVVNFGNDQITLNF